ncbi:hypothetical protein LTR16_012506, partial [Cryomyces antarcticus]
ALPAFQILPRPGHRPARRSPRRALRRPSRVRQLLRGGELAVRAARQARGPARLPPHGRRGGRPIGRRRGLPRGARVGPSAHRRLGLGYRAGGHAVCGPEAHRRRAELWHAEE